MEFPAVNYISHHLNLGHRRAVPVQKPILKLVYTFLWTGSFPPRAILHNLNYTTSAKRLIVHIYVALLWCHFQYEVINRIQNTNKLLLFDIIGNSKTCSIVLFFRMSTNLEVCPVAMLKLCSLKGVVFRLLANVVSWPNFNLCFTHKPIDFLKLIKFCIEWLFSNCK